MSNNYYPEFVRLLTHHLQRADRSASWLARQLDINPSTVSKWQNAVSRPNSPELVIRIADILGVHDARERQALLHAAGYGYLSSAPTEGQPPSPINTNLDPLQQSTEFEAREMSAQPENATASEDNPTPIQPEQTELTGNQQALAWHRWRTKSASVLQAAWLHLHTKPAVRWNSVGGLGLLLLLGLSYPLLWEWPLIRISLGAILAILGLGLSAWNKNSRSSSSRRLFGLVSHYRWARVGAGVLLMVSLGLWVIIGLPKLYGQWAYPGMEENGDRFGYALASGDFNDDGYADLAVSAVGEAPIFNSTAPSGWVYVFDNNRYGNLIHGTNLGQAGFGLNEQGDRFGWALAAGDFNGDGIDDLAVSAPGESLWRTQESGYVYVFRGTTHGLVPWTTIDQHLLGTNEANDGFGWSLAAADFNHDGKDDLAIGAPFEQPGIMAYSGYVFIFTGRSYGFQQWFGLRQENLALDEDGDLFGWSLAAGDFNHDGIIELAVGAPGDRVDNDPEQALTGQVFIFQCDFKQGPQPWQAIALRKDSAKANADRFGTSLAVADFTGDGLDDLAVGAPGPLPDQAQALPVAGAVYLYQGGSDSLTLWDELDQSIFHPKQELALFGWSLRSGDFNHDQKPDLAVSAPNQQGKGNDGGLRSGAVFTFRNNGTHLDAWHLLTEPPIAQDQSDDWFGLAMTTIDLNQDNTMELVIGAPGGVNNRSWVSGYVYPYRFSTSGPVAAQGLQQ